MKIVVKTVTLILALSVWLADFLPVWPFVHQFIHLSVHSSVWIKIFCKCYIGESYSSLMPGWASFNNLLDKNSSQDSNIDPGMFSGRWLGSWSASCATSWRSRRRSSLGTYKRRIGVTRWVDIRVGTRILFLRLPRNSRSQDWVPCNYAKAAERHSRPMPH